MKKFKILAATLVVLMTVVFFAGCGNSNYFLTAKNIKTLSAAQLNLDGADIVSGINNNVVIIEKDSKYGLLNLETNYSTGTIYDYIDNTSNGNIYAARKIVTIEGTDSARYGFITISSQTDFDSETWSELVILNDLYDSYFDDLNQISGMIICQTKTNFYEMKNKTFTKAMAIDNYKAEIFKYASENGNGEDNLILSYRGNYILKQVDDDRIYFYDKTYNLKEVLFYDDNTEQIQHLSNGKVVIQKMIKVPDIETNYDFFEPNTGEKFLIETKIFNPENGKTTSVKVDYMIVMVLTKSEIEDQISSMYDISIGNNETMIMGYKIKNKTIDSYSIFTAIVNDSLKVVYSYDENVSFEIFKGNFKAIAINNDILKLTYRGKNIFVGEYYDVYMSDDFVVIESGSGYYALNKNGRSEKTYDYLIIGQNALFGIRNGKFYKIDKNLNETEIADCVDLYSHFYIVEKNSKFEIYNLNSVKLLTVDSIDDINFGTNLVLLEVTIDTVASTYVLK